MHHVSRLASFVVVAAFDLFINAQGGSDCRCCSEIADVDADVVFVGQVIEAEYRWSLVNWAYTKVRNLVRFDGGRWVAP
jgi:hypothetical protein